MSIFGERGEKKTEREREREIDFISIAISGPQRPKELGKGSVDLVLAQTSRSISHVILFWCIFNHVHNLFIQN